MISNVVFKSNVKWNPESDVLWSDQDKVTLNYSEYQVLLVLYRRLGQPVPKEELIAAAWPNRIITDSSLFQVIRSLRGKLGEPEKGVYLENVSKVGYILKPDALTVKTEKKTSHWVTGITFGAMALLAAVAGGVFWLGTSPDVEQEQLYISYDVMTGNHITLYSDSAELLLPLREYAERLISLLPNKERMLYFYQTKHALYIAGCNSQNRICDESESFSVMLNRSEKEQRLTQLAQDIKQRYLAKRELRADMSSKTQWLSNVYRYLDDNTTVQYSTRSISSGESCDNQVFSGVMYAADLNEQSHTIGVRGGRAKLQQPDFEEFMASADVKLSILKFDNALLSNAGQYASELMRMAGTEKGSYRIHLPYSQHNMGLLLIPGQSMNWVYGLDVSSCME
ncbi:hypothetical protein C9I98_22205 [Photobacterium sanctipauli]|uniref:OmpR/PhoB-type domain-containing protein n=3 Tax=Photobacterium sanctipauli TaxID=1342794 RepID=A0A2T3NGP2_9GAMM|nr:hypothetical protein C9I98_22205 [Photobacterium sanctipauli]